jgi:hypothetical protein
MLLTNQVLSLDLFTIFYTSVLDIYSIIGTILFSTIVVSVGPIIFYYTRKLGENLGRNTGNIGAIAAVTNVALNIYNTLQDTKDKSGNSGSDNNSGDNSEDD